MRTVRIDISKLPITRIGFKFGAGFYLGYNLIKAIDKGLSERKTPLINIVVDRKSKENKDEE